MIKANELRIGNKVLRTKTNSIFTITAIDISTIANGDLTVTGIPLTPEILEAFGFKQFGKWFILYDYPIQINISLEHNKTTFGINEEYEINNIQFLHQLQNTFFSFAGQEIKNESFHVATSH